MPARETNSHLRALLSPAQFASDFVVTEMRDRKRVGASGPACKRQRRGQGDCPDTGGEASIVELNFVSFMLHKCNLGTIEVRRPPSCTRALLCRARAPTPCLRYDKL